MHLMQTRYDLQCLRSHALGMYIECIFYKQKHVCLCECVFTAVCLCVSMIVIGIYRISFSPTHTITQRYRMTICYKRVVTNRL